MLVYVGLPLAKERGWLPQATDFGYHKRVSKLLVISCGEEGSIKGRETAKSRGLPGTCKQSRRWRSKMTIFLTRQPNAHCSHTETHEHKVKDENYTKKIEP